MDRLLYLTNCFTKYIIIVAETDRSSYIRGGIDMLIKDNKKRYSSDEFLAMTDLEGRYELVSGEIYAMSPAPNIRHQILSGNLFLRIGNYIKDHKGKCHVLSAPTDVKLNDEDTVQPDIFVVCDPDKLDEQKCNGAPDWIIEILSPGNSEHDTVEKLSIYLKAGVREYWIVDPMSEKVLVYPFEATKAVGVFTFNDKITAGIYKEESEPLTICINEL